MGMQPAAFNQTLHDLASAVRCPVLLLPAGGDPDNLKEDGEFTRWLPNGSSSHTYPDMKHGYMSRAVKDKSGLANMMGGSIEDIERDQADALRRTIDFFKAALQKPPVPPTSPPALKPAKGGQGKNWLLLLAAITVAGLAVLK